MSANARKARAGCPGLTAACWRWSGGARSLLEGPMHHAAGTGRGWGLAPRNCAPRPLQPRAGPRSPQSPRADPARLRSTLGATGRARLGSSRPGFLGSAGEASAASGPPRHPTMVRGPTRSADPAGSRVGGGLPTRPLTPEGRSRLGRARPGGRSPEPGGRLAFPAGGTRALHGARPDRADGLVSPWQRGWPCGCSPPAFRPALNTLLARREKEWRALQEMALEEARDQLRSLQEDFVYNLQVLEERDRELERYDAAFARARGLEEAWQAEVSQLKVEAARLRQALAREAERREDLQQLHQRELREHRLALERAHSDKNGEMDQQREQYEKLKWKLERRLQELDGELALQRQELLQEFESEMQKRERGFRLQADSLSHAALTHELQVKLLNKELAALTEAGAQAAESLQSAQMANLELEERLQRGAQELRDLAAVKDARIKDLEDRLHSVQLTRQKEEETFRRKHEELDRLARERDAVLASVKDAHAEQLRALEARVVELQAHCEALELQLRRAEWRQTDALKEKDAALDRLREEAAALRSGWDAQIAQLSRDATSKDLQVQSLREEEAKLKAQLARCQQDVARYQQQLSLAAEREQSLEREKVQLVLDWQHRCAGVERDHYQKSEELIQGLTAAREQAAAKLQEAERKLCDQEVLLKAVTLERDQAVRELRTHGPRPEEEAQMPLRHQEEEISQSFSSSEIQRLQEQNTSLRDAIAQMRTEMEALSEHVPPSAQLGGDTTDAQQPDSKAAAVATIPDYVLALEAEIRNLKHKFKTLEEQLEEPSRVFSSNADIQPSVCTSEGATGGAVPTAGASTGSALRRLGDRAHLLNFLVSRLRQKVLQEPLDEGAVRRELAHEVDQVCLEVSELRKRTAELEKHLGTAPEAGGGPPSRQQPRAPDTMALGKEGPADAGPAGTEGPAVQRLQRKLKEAARKILHLRLEKEQLLELGNRLRAELGRHAGHRAGMASPGRHPPSDEGVVTPSCP
ncbi:coiled-coil domain-containing protein 57 isoform 4-T4 [Hipposideros larvatus]